MGKTCKRTVTIVLCIVFVSAGPNVCGIIIIIIIRWDYSLSCKLYKHSEAWNSCTVLGDSDSTLHKTYCILIINSSLLTFRNTIAVYFENFTNSLTNQLTNLTEQRTSGEANSYSGNSLHSMRPKKYYRPHRSAPFGPLLGLISPVCVVPSYFLRIHLIFSRLWLGLPSGLFP